MLAALGLSLLVTAITASTAIAKGRALVFFNEYCITCRQDAHLVSAWAVKARAHYRITAVGFRELRAESTTFARSLGWSFAVIGDPDGQIAARWHVGTPTIIVLIGRHVRREDYSRWKGAAAASLRVRTEAVSRKKPKNKRGKSTSTPPPATTAAFGSVLLAGSTVTVQSSREVLVKLTCTGTATCRGKLTLTVKRTTTKRGKRKQTKVQTIGTATFSIPAGKTAAIKLKLNAAGQALLSAHHGRLSATLTILKASPKPAKRQIRSVHLVQRRAANTPPAITPHPIFVSNFAWRSQLGQDRYVLIRYLRLDSESSAQDAEFAQGAQASAPGIIGLPVTCGSSGEIEPLLVKGGISAPVTVDTAPDCQAALMAISMGSPRRNGGSAPDRKRSDRSGCFAPMVSRWRLTSS